MSEYAGSRSWGQRDEGAAGHAERSPGKQTLVEQSASSIQLRAEAEGGGEPGDVQQLAGRGTATAGGSLPYFDIIQAAFGHHDISGLIAHTGAEAGETAKGMGAKGYTAGRHVVLGPGSDLFTVAHEAAHYVEQRHGLVSVAGGVGKAGDLYEQHADAVAAKVVAGESAEGLLDEYVGKGKGGAAPAGADSGPVQKQETEVAAHKNAQRATTLGQAHAFEQKLGVAAYKDPRSEAIASEMINRMLQAVIPAFDANNDDHKAQYGDLFGRDNIPSGEANSGNPRQDGRWSAGQVGREFEVLRQALQSGNLREKMTGVFNAAMGGFKETVQGLRGEDSMTARGVDADKLKRRQRWAKTPKLLGGGDIYRNPGNPVDRKHVFNGKGGLDWESSSDSRVKRPDAEHQTERTVGDLDQEGIGLSEREKRFQFGDAPPAGTDTLMWHEGGTVWGPNDKSKWVQKYRDKLLMPLSAGPSGTALRMFQAWELLGKPPQADHFRLALLGWMLTGNDHSFHEIMTTSAQFGLPYTPGLDAYRDIAPFSQEELRAIARPEGFPDEQEYLGQHAKMVEPSEETKAKERNKDLRDKGQFFERHSAIAEGEPTAVFTLPRHTAKLSERLQIDPDREQRQKKRPEALQDLRGVPDDEIGQILGLLLYSDDRKKPGGVSAFEFINTVLRDDIGMRITLWHHIKKDAALKEAWNANKFNIKDLIAEAKQHAKFAAEGLKRMDAYNGPVYRGYKSMTKPSAGKSWVEKKFLSMSTIEDLSKGYATNDSLGTHSILVTMQCVSGRKIDAASMFGAEGEVLFAPGSRFTIVGEPQPWEGVKNGWKVTWRDDSPPPAARAQGPAVDGDDSEDADGGPAPQLAPTSADEITEIPSS